MGRSVGERDRLGETGRGAPTQADDGVGVRLGRCGPGPFGELEGHVLDDLVPMRDDERAERLGKRVAELLGLAVDDEEDALGA